MRLGRVLAVVSIVAFWAPPAEAARSWWGWLEELSGPGPFVGMLYSTPVVCWNAENRRVSCELFARIDVERDVHVKRTLQLTGGVLSSGHQPRFDALVGIGSEEERNRRRVFAVPVNAAYMFRPHRSLDIGPGAGIVYFEGSNVRAKARFVVVPVNLSWKFLLYGRTPAPPWKRMFSLEYQGSYLTKGFSAADFGGPPSQPDISREFRHCLGFALDLGELVKAR